MYIIGKAEEADRLADAALQKMKFIYEETKTIKTELSRLQESFQDNGMAPVEQAVNTVIMSINSHFDDIVKLSKVLKEYAEILRRQS